MYRIPIKSKDNFSKTAIKSYITGLSFSILLTVVPFLVVLNGQISRTSILSIVLICAVCQILVHLIYFLHLNRQSEGGWTLISSIFVAIIVLIIIVGSLWIMSNLNQNMVHD
ncbi:Cytochrome bo(3) ubiquinol oxidase subunit 4 [Candidatus Erwinia haradaeae]|uniref:Cytochrome bo(3) ubiquinol oxidase subunit 4 n=1 Tax=Candidatus Erwinia haradaeae TaxID=1922217 RepID=A0A451CZN3_9GAMM|nr:cytochrome o ubiquinol oxidase subunit IV [Candidatus Erwinia haradaeae]VFP78898.1 Cytochrome bo(3) ubiquinol oxidase subunit 4 [Candidatus Erwinia haradaeae]